VKQSQAEGFKSVEHLKRYTTLGMATDQGKTSNILGLAVMAEATGKTIPETGTTIFRPTLFACCNWRIWRQGARSTLPPNSPNAKS
jgi:hypothetical protein